MKFRSAPTFHVAAVIGMLAVLPILANPEAVEKPYIDAILQRPASPTPGQITTLDRNTDGQVDVRDLVIFLDGQPVSASFGSAESIQYASENSATSVSLPITFSKPVEGTVRFDLGGSALATGAQRDITILTTQIVLTQPTTSTEITITIEPWRGFGGEKVVRISLTRDPGVLPANGRFPSHLLRLRQFDAGEFVGMLTFPASSGLPALPVRIGLMSDGAAICSFQNPNTLLGERLNLGWSPGPQGFPNLSGSPVIPIAKETLNRGTDLSATMTFQRLASPYTAEINALLEGFPANGKPAVYHANFMLPDLFAAGAPASGGTFAQHAINHQGRLVVNLVNYSEDP